MTRSAFALVLAIALGLTPSAARADDPPIAPPTSRAVTPLAGGHELLWPATPPPSALDRPILRRGHDMGLITAGIVGLSAGMIAGLVIAALDLTRGNCTTFSGSTFTFSRVQCETAPFALMPLAGATLVGVLSLDNRWPTSDVIVPGIIAAAPQIAGLVFLLIGMHGFTEDLVSDIDLGEATLRFTPTLSSTQLGGLLSVSL